MGALEPELRAFLHAAFPFHVCVDEGQRVVDLGTSAQLVAPGLERGDLLTEHLSIYRPLGLRTVHDITRRSQPAVVLRAIATGIDLRYQVYVADGGIACLVGSPRARDATSMIKNGITVQCYALHDVMPDYLLALQAKNHLLRESSELAERLKASNDDLEERVAERTAQLQAAVDVAQAASQAKSEFLANMSHEIRTPLNGVAGMAQLLQQTDLGEHQRELTDHLVQSAELLQRVIGDVLDFSKIEAGQLELESVPFEPSGLIRALVASFSPQLHGGTRIGAEVDPRIPDWLKGDPTRLRQVLTNLVGNAVKFTPAGAILVRAMHLGGTTSRCEVRFEVEDEGIGIDADKLHEIFESFRQADNSTTRRFGGTGLGLSITRRLVELMGGTISVDSSLGAGSRFWFDLSLPVASPPLADGAMPAAPTAGLRVLVAEDNAVNQRVMQHLLTSLKTEWQIVDEGGAALRALENGAFDVVLMDVHMPGMDGLEATRRIRSLADRCLAAIPVIAVTASAVDEQVRECLAAGMNEVVTKPVRIAHLRSLLGRYGTPPAASD